MLTSMKFNIFSINTYSMDRSICKTPATEKNVEGQTVRFVVKPKGNSWIVLWFDRLTIFTSRIETPSPPPSPFTNRNSCAQCNQISIGRGKILNRKSPRGVTEYTTAGQRDQRKQNIAFSLFGFYASPRPGVKKVTREKPIDIDRE